MERYHENIPGHGQHHRDQESPGVRRHRRRHHQPQPGRQGGPGVHPLGAGDHRSGPGAGLRRSDGQQPGGDDRPGGTYAALAANVVVKVPINLEGLQVVKTLSGRGIKTNVTLVFSPRRHCWPPRPGQPTCRRSSAASTTSPETAWPWSRTSPSFSTITISPPRSSSPRFAHPLHFVEAARIGAHVATIPFATLAQLLNHPLTSSGMERFLKDWEKVKR